MGALGALGHEQDTLVPSPGNWVVKVELSHGLEVASRPACAVCLQDDHRNRQFMANLAFDMVLLFRHEEERLSRARSPLLANRRLEHRRLAQELRVLMQEHDQGLDVTNGIQCFLGHWQAHLGQIGIQRTPAVYGGH